MTQQGMKTLRWFEIGCITLFLSQHYNAAHGLQANPVVLGK